MDDPSESSSTPAIRPEDRRAIMDHEPPSAHRSEPPPPPPTIIEKRLAKRQPSNAQGVMSLGDHLEELRTRFIHAIVGILVFFLVSLYYGPTILNWLIWPVQRALRAEGLSPSMLATGMFETFFTYLKISTVAAILLGFPWILWQAWKFIAPGLHRHEQRFVTMLLPMSLVLAILSTLFLYFVVLPVMLHFFVHFGATVSPEKPTVAPLPANVSLLSLPVLTADPPAPKPGDAWFNSELKELRLALAMPSGAVAIYSTALSTSTGIVLQPRIQEWVDSFLGLALAFAAGFQLPVVVLLLGWVGIVTPAFLSQYRKHALFIIAIIAALLTPPDPISMVILMAPLWLLYEFGIVMLRLFPASRLAHDRGREWDGEPTEG
ncbi:MAG: preprotein translocase subunit TatC [Phycisphaerae bacterium]|nr:preprotein translocase subunit TatC [Phycisphaerae bacterium]